MSHTSKNHWPRLYSQATSSLLARVSRFSRAATGTAIKHAVDGAAFGVGARIMARSVYRPPDNASRRRGSSAENISWIGAAHHVGIITPDMQPVLNSPGSKESDDGDLPTSRAARAFSLFAMPHYTFRQAARTELSGGAVPPINGASLGYSHHFRAAPTAVPHVGTRAFIASQSSPSRHHNGMRISAPANMLTTKNLAAAPTATGLPISHRPLSVNPREGDLGERRVGSTLATQWSGEPQSTTPGKAKAFAPVTRQDGAYYANSSGIIAPSANQLGAQAEGATPRSMGAIPPLSVPDTQTDNREAATGPTGGDVYLDGVLVGRWMSRMLAKEASRPATGGAAFDPTRTPYASGRMIG